MGQLAAVMAGGITINYPDWRVWSDSQWGLTPSATWRPNRGLFEYAALPENSLSFERQDRQSDPINHAADKLRIALKVEPRHLRATR